MTATDLHARLAALGLNPRPFAAGALGVKLSAWDQMRHRGQALTDEQRAAARSALRAHASACRDLSKAV